MNNNDDTASGKIISRLNDIPLKEHIAAGLRYSRSKAKRYPDNLGLPEPEDILQAALINIVDGSRTWKADKFEFRVLLIQTIRSLYSFEVKKAYRMLREAQEYVSDSAVINVNFASSPEEDREYLLENKKFLEENYPDICNFYEEASVLLADPDETFASAAKAMNMSKGSFTKKVQRIKTIIKKWREEQSLGAFGCEEKNK